MVRPIDANALLIQMKEYLERREEEANMTGNRSACVTWNDAVMLIKNAPTVETQPVRRGEWELSRYASKWRCDNCGRTVDEDEANTEYDYCPHCGSRMNGE